MYIKILLENVDLLNILKRNYMVSINNSLSHNIDYSLLKFRVLIELYDKTSIIMCIQMSKDLVEVRLKLFLLFLTFSHACLLGTVFPLTDSSFEIIMLIIVEDVVENVIFKNALIPFTCDQFSESTTLRSIIKMQLLCRRCFTSNAFRLYLCHFQETVSLLFGSFWLSYDYCQI